MLRSYDWGCPKCDRLVNDLVDVEQGADPPKTNLLECPEHGPQLHYRAPSLTGKYYADRPFNPEIRVGSWDTMGNVQALPVPELPGSLEHGRKVANAITEAMAAGASEEAIASARRDACRDGPMDADYLAHWSKPEVKEIEAKNAIIEDQNKQKRARAGAIARGENINMRVDRCAGDPKNIVA